MLVLFKGAYLWVDPSTNLAALALELEVVVDTDQLVLLLHPWPVPWSSVNKGESAPIPLTI